jgi:hypothetical protein
MRGAIAACAAAGLAVFCHGAGAAETFQKLGGAQIRAKISGMELSDGVHSRDAFAPDGTLTTYAMSKKTVGRWRIAADELCLAPSKDQESCYVVWAAGRKLELRRNGSDLPLIEGELRRAGREK